MTTPATNNAGTNNFVVLKIQLKHEAKSEYYRKRIDVDSLTFTQLHELLQSVVVTPDNSWLVITYLDSDLDEIRVNDDADLREALLMKDETRSDTLRLSVKVVPCPHTSPNFSCNPGSAGDLRQHSSVGPSSNSSTCCPNRRQILRQHKRSGCQRRPVTREDGTIVPFFIEHSVLPHHPWHICDMFTIKSLEHDNSTLIEELFAQPLLAALLQTTAVDAQAPASNTAKTERSDSDFNVILEAFRDFEDISQRLRGFDSLFGSPFCASRRVCESKAGLERSPEPKPAEFTPSDPKKEDVELQAAIENSLSKTNASESATPGPAPKAEHENDNDEVTAVQSTAPSMASNAKGGSTAQTAPVVPPLEGSPAEAKADTCERLHSEAAKGPYESEIEQLKSMGFYDIEAVSAALRATDGNVEYALWRLI